MDILLFLGISVVAGLAGGRLLEKVGIPKVVGYILAGLVLGDSFAGLLPRDLLVVMDPINQIALGFIGFMVGGELKAQVFRKYGPKFLVILVCEGMLAAVLVGAAVTVLTGKLYLGLLLGALASATAPAATVNVLWEYRSKGPLTTTILAIVALDDGLGLLLYAFAVTIAQVLLGTHSAVGWTTWLEPLREIFGSLALGGLAGLFLNLALRRLRGNTNQTLSLLTGMILLVCGTATRFELSQILANMAMGVVLINLLPQRKEKAFDTIKNFTPPIYILFFVFIGARLDVSLLPRLGLVGLVYLVGRTLGKMAGSYLGGWISGAPEQVRKYLGWALFSQAGVAIGLALDIFHRFARLGPAGREAGGTVLNVIAATTVIVQILGPPAVKYAIGRAGEIPAEMRKGE
jgi:Kef-type K+ transport system membrane component KefB